MTVGARCAVEELEDQPHDLVLAELDTAVVEDHARSANQLGLARRRGSTGSGRGQQARRGIRRWPRRPAPAARRSATSDSRKR